MLGSTCKDMKLIGLMKWGTGIDSIDHDAASKYNVIIKNTPDAFSEPVAESILGSILSFNRGLLSSTRMMQQLQNSSEPLKTVWVKVPGKTLPETTFGIIGFGNVGKAIARKLLKLGAKSILTYDILGEMDFPEHENGNRLWQLKSMNEVLDSNPDFLLITCSGNKDNIKMIGRHELSRLNKGKTVIINMARGSLLDEPEMIKALQGFEGICLKGAALDVYWDEPLPADSALRNLPNVILTSHNANSSPLYWLKVHLNTIKNTFELLSTVSIS
jgi:D-3-phosphoglycerate dehydrogenase / 2-oxoglutarate reductase